MAKKYDSRFLIIEGKGREFVAAGMGGGEVQDKGIVTEGAFAGFNMISVTGSELVCDDCNGSIGDDDTAYYIAVLNMLFCKECFEQWHKNAKYYPEDAEAEKANYEYYKNLMQC